jgi:hypothetical protein
MRIRIRLITLMRIPIPNFIYADPDPQLHCLYKPTRLQICTYSSMTKMMIMISVVMTENDCGPRHATSLLINSKLIYVYSHGSPHAVATSVSDPDPDWIRIQSCQWIRIRIQEGKKDPQKWKKLRNFKCWMFPFEGWRLFFAVHFFQFLVIKTLDLDSDPDRYSA